MKTANPKDKASDLFSYILVNCPNFPPSTGSTIAKEFGILMSLLDTLFKNARNDDAKQWLGVCQQEVRQSWKSYDDGNVKDGKKLIQIAKGHFDNAFSNKPTAARFIVNKSGSTSDENSGVST
jgi:hypothetical protein